MFKDLSPKIQKLIQSFSLLTYVAISIGLIIGCAVLFPDRIGGLLGFVNRMFIGVVFVNVLFAVQKLPAQDKPILMAAAIIAAGFAV